MNVFTELKSKNSLFIIKPMKNLTSLAWNTLLAKIYSNAKKLLEKISSKQYLHNLRKLTNPRKN